MLTSFKQLLTRLALPTLTAAAVALPAAPADAFCGFYVAGADAELYNNATLVVMMRDGTRTVLAMQNDYQGPPEDFALVIPVPVVLQEDNVKTLPTSIFERVDKLAAPRLVEYWEEDPCQARRDYEEMKNEDGAVEYSMAPGGARGKHGVKIEAEFEVGEYQIVVLSAEDSTGLDTWLREENYNIPEDAEPVLRPYVEGGMKFFVAKVDAEKVKFEKLPNGGERAMLSPLRFHYDSEAFTLPVRLGLINANGPQDLLVHIVAPKHRYQVANYENVTIPTNLVVKDAVREHFGEFYVSLFDHTLAQNPKAVVTEYAWSAGSCDPCPEDPLSFEELVLLGANLLPRYQDKFDEQGQPKPEADDLQWSMAGDFVLTRMHARYDAESLGEDLVFEQAEGLQGGRGVPHSRGKLDSTVSPGGAYNNFQARYAILHFWQGAVQCKDPMWDSWGGPPSGQSGPSGPAVARELAFVDREASLGSYVTASAHEALKLAGEAPADERPPRPKGEASSKDDTKPSKSASKRGCKCSAEDTGPAGGFVGGLLGLGLLGLGLRRRRRP
jgi:MYXO-CTERM domain-containing protein